MILFRRLTLMMALLLTSSNSYSTDIFQDVRITSCCAAGLILCAGGIRIATKNAKTTQQYITQALGSLSLFAVGLCLLITSREIIQEYDKFLIEQRLTHSEYNWDSFIQWLNAQRGY